MDQETSQENQTLQNRRFSWPEPVSFMLGITFLVAFGEMVIVHFRYGTLRSGIIWQTIGWYMLAWLLFGGAIWWAERRPDSFNPAWVWGIALGARLLLLLTTPTLSDDVYRYLWDGYIANQGVSPYALPIDSTQLDTYDIPIRALANNSWMASPYMPAAQILFRSVTALFPLAPISMQAVMLIFDLATATLLSLLLVQTGLPSRRILLYLWNPLVIVEIAHSAHVDAWMILLMVLAILFSYFNLTSSETGSVRREMVAPILLSFATLTKILPILIFPILFWRWNRLQRVTYGLLSLFLLLPAGLLAGWGLWGPLDGRGLFGALRIYNDQWNFNSGIFYWLTHALDTGGRTSDDAELLGRLIIAVVMLIVLFVVWLIAAPDSFRREVWPWSMSTETTPVDSENRESDSSSSASPIGVGLLIRRDLRLMAVPLIGYVLLTHTFHPWYLLILIPFLLFLAPDQEESPLSWLWVSPWLYLSGALFFSYVTYIDPNDLREFEWIRMLEWIPTFALFGLAVYFWLIRKVTSDE